MANKTFTITIHPPLLRQTQTFQFNNSLDAASMVADFHILDSHLGYRAYQQINALAPGRSISFYPIIVRRHNSVAD